MKKTILITAFAIASTTSFSQDLSVNGHINIMGNGTHLTFKHYSGNGVIDYGNMGYGDLYFRTLPNNSSISPYTDRIVFKKDGKVGIGVMDPTQFLDIEGNISVRGTHMVFNSQHGCIDWGHLGVGDLVFRTLSSMGQIGGYSDKMIIKNNGKVGIGTSNPLGKLQVSDGSDALLNVYTESANKSRMAVMNSIYSYAFGIDANGEGHLWGDVWNMNKIMNFWIHGTYGAQAWVGNQKPGSGAHVDFRMAVDGKLVAKEVIVTQLPWADHVFEKDYKLTSLSEVEAYYKANKHLPEIPSAKEVEESGISVGEMNKLLLQKIEELTIHVVEQQKQIDALKAQKN